MLCNVAVIPRLVDLFIVKLSRVTLGGEGGLCDVYTISPHIFDDFCGGLQVLGFAVGTELLYVFYVHGTGWRHRTRYVERAPPLVHLLFSTSLSRLIRYGE
jgi:hypothetical protein